MPHSQQTASSSSAMPMVKSTAEKVLIALAALPGNNSCCDCHTTIGVDWASLAFGVFVCIRCAGLYRELGSNLGKVKSVKLNSWTNEEVLSLQHRGNRLMQHYFERHCPQESRINWQSPTEKVREFIVDKYINKKFAADGEPPWMQTLPLGWVAFVDEANEQRVAYFGLLSRAIRRDVPTAPDSEGEESLSDERGAGLPVNFERGMFSPLLDSLLIESKVAFGQWNARLLEDEFELCAGLHQEKVDNLAIRRQEFRSDCLESYAALTIRRTMLSIPCSCHISARLFSNRSGQFVSNPFECVTGVDGVPPGYAAGLSVLFYGFPLSMIREDDIYLVFHVYQYLPCQSNIGLRVATRVPLGVSIFSLSDAMRGANPGFFMEPQTAPILHQPPDDVSFPNWHQHLLANPRANATPVPRSIGLAIEYAIFDEIPRHLGTARNSMVSVTPIEDCFEFAEIESDSYNKIFQSFFYDRPLHFPNIPPLPFDIRRLREELVVSLECIECPPTIFSGFKSTPVHFEVALEIVPISGDALELQEIEIIRKIGSGQTSQHAHYFAGCRFSPFPVFRESISISIPRIGSIPKVWLFLSIFKVKEKAEGVFKRKVRSFTYIPLSAALNFEKKRLPCRKMLLGDSMPPTKLHPQGILAENSSTLSRDAMCISTKCYSSNPSFSGIHVDAGTFGSRSISALEQTVFMSPVTLGRNLFAVLDGLNRVADLSTNMAELERISDCVICAAVLSTPSSNRYFRGINSRMYKYLSSTRPFSANLSVPLASRLEKAIRDSKGTQKICIIEATPIILAFASRCCRLQSDGVSDPHLFPLALSVLFSRVLDALVAVATSNLEASIGRPENAAGGVGGSNGDDNASLSNNDQTNQDEWKKLVSVTRKSFLSSLAIVRRGTRFGEISGTIERALSSGITAPYGSTAFVSSLEISLGIFSFQFGDLLPPGSCAQPLVQLWKKTLSSENADDVSVVVCLRALLKLISKTFDCMAEENKANAAAISKEDDFNQQLQERLNTFTDDNEAESVADSSSSSVALREIENMAIFHARQRANSTTSNASSSKASLKVENLETVVQVHTDGNYHSSELFGGKKQSDSDSNIPKASAETVNVVKNILLQARKSVTTEEKESEERKKSSSRYSRILSHDDGKKGGKEEEEEGGEKALKQRKAEAGGGIRVGYQVWLDQVITPLLGPVIFALRHRFSADECVNRNEIISSLSAASGGGRTAWNVATSCSAALHGDWNQRAACRDGIRLHWLECRALGYICLTAAISIIEPAVLEQKYMFTWSDEEDKDDASGGALLDQGKRFQVRGLANAGALQQIHREIQRKRASEDGNRPSSLLIPSHPSRFQRQLDLEENKLSAVGKPEEIGHNKDYSQFFLLLQSLFCDPASPSFPPAGKHLLRGCFELVSDRISLAIPVDKHEEGERGVAQPLPLSNVPGAISKKTAHRFFEIATTTATTQSKADIIITHGGKLSTLLPHRHADVGIVLRFLLDMVQAASLSVDEEKEENKMGSIISSSSSVRSERKQGTWVDCFCMSSFASAQHIWNQYPISFYEFAFPFCAKSLLRLCLSDSLCLPVRRLAINAIAFAAGEELKKQHKVEDPSQQQQQQQQPMKTRIALFRSLMSILQQAINVSSDKSTAEAEVVTNKLEILWSSLMKDAELQKLKSDMEMFSCHVIDIFSLPASPEWEALLVTRLLNIIAFLHHNGDWKLHSEFVEKLISVHVNRKSFFEAATSALLLNSSPLYSYLARDVSTIWRAVSLFNCGEHWEHSLRLCARLKTTLSRENSNASAASVVVSQEEIDTMSANLQRQLAVCRRTEPIFVWIALRVLDQEQYWVERCCQEEGEDDVAKYMRRLYPKLPQLSMISEFDKLSPHPAVCVCRVEASSEYEMQSGLISRYAPSVPFNEVYHERFYNVSVFCYELEGFGCMEFLQVQEPLPAIAKRISVLKRQKVTLTPIKAAVRETMFYLADLEYHLPRADNKADISPLSPLPSVLISHELREKVTGEGLTRLRRRMKRFEEMATSSKSDAVENKNDCVLLINNLKELEQVLERAVALCAMPFRTVLESIRDRAEGGVAAAVATPSSAVGGNESDASPSSLLSSNLVDNNEEEKDSDKKQSNNNDDDDDDGGGGGNRRTLQNLLVDEEEEEEEANNNNNNNDSNIIEKKDDIEEAEKVILAFAARKLEESIDEVAV